VSVKQDKVTGGEDVVGGFRSALASLEAARNLLSRRRPVESALELGRCAGTLVQLRIDVGLPPDPGLSAGMTAAQTAADSGALTAGQLRRRYANQRDAMVKVRRELVSAGYARQANRQLPGDSACRPNVAAGLALVALATVVLVALAVFRYLQPATVFEAAGQLFWKTAGEKPFSEKLSSHFSVQVDGNDRAYVVTLPSASRVVMLRLDPANRAAITGITITRLELLNKAGNLVADFKPADFAGWSCNNCETVTKGAEGYVVRPLNNDPYLVSAEFAPVPVGKVVVHMRAEARKRFWEWVLGLDAGS